MFSIYFARSLKNGKVYVGKTDKDPEQRVREHNKGANEWTRHNGPFALVYFEHFLCKEDASHRELFYKSGFGKKVKKVIIEAIEKSKIRSRSLTG